LQIQIEERDSIIQKVSRSNDENRQRSRTLESKMKKLQTWKDEGNERIGWENGNREGVVK